MWNCSTGSEKKTDRLFFSSSDFIVMTREEKTVEAMILIYCRHHHGSEVRLCSECQRLLDYARERLQYCSLKADKPTCARCAIHCYESSMREMIRTVMRYSGPVMIFRHPILAFFHLLAGIKPRQ
jgi:hypothetical protein